LILRVKFFPVHVTLCVRLLAWAQVPTLDVREDGSAVPAVIHAAGEFSGSPPPPRSGRVYEELMFLRQRFAELSPRPPRHSSLYFPTSLVFSEPLRSRFPFFFFSRFRALFPGPDLALLQGGPPPKGASPTISEICFLLRPGTSSLAIATLPFSTVTNFGALALFTQVSFSATDFLFCILLLPPHQQTHLLFGHSPPQTPFATLSHPPPLCELTCGRRPGWLSCDFWHKIWGPLAVEMAAFDDPGTQTMSPRVHVETLRIDLWLLFVRFFPMSQHILLLDDVFFLTFLFCPGVAFFA